MSKIEFERLLDVCCGTLTHEARTIGFTTSAQFELRVRQVIDDLLRDERALHVDFESPPQGFPDTPIGEFGVEVKFTLSDTWKSIGNSILESQRAAGVKYIYIVFGKMGGKPEVRWGDYEKSAYQNGWRKPMRLLLVGDYPKFCSYRPLNGGSPTSDHFRLYLHGAVCDSHFAWDQAG